MSSRRSTIADVAREAGVSASTASVVFSGKTPVTPATRQRVLDAAGALGYTGPDPRAASLRRGRSGIVGVVFEGHLGGAFLDPVTRAMMDGLADAVAPQGAGLLLLRDDVESGATLTTAPIDAAVLIGCSARMRASLEIVLSRGIPVVVIEGDAGAGVPAVMLDNSFAQRVVAEHLKKLGHSRVALVTLPTDVLGERGWVDHRREATITVDVMRDRLEGARQVFPDAPALSARRSSIDEGVIAGRVIFASAERPTAVVAQSDLLAAGVIRAAEEAGLRVPADVSVTGFDGVDVDGLAPYRLTTMSQPASEKGRAAGRAVTAMLDGEKTRTIEFTCVFREGNTTGAPARS
ncbi:DNA-binding LacI/PurR family transcriptional regulator [Microbacterium endophyticum]|uniref:DNA-binding LacI/PurR family transcriptional regulator n=1 Tax=Microbacterium endophyticum TaxID=1526412 RepID=A0A7W4V473_9MICO|nr:LacI family DNA-binding transcriptional regulator [Microbacterium endophyticum]MBB2976558.1 DNA-binding LacI/PurR family transcriptional regulator [Microbacterium endophyticum]NIK36004.1 DNA-binding LacI/PurR family transcriptional regulator [Microbacterium endophyticum]